MRRKKKGNLAETLLGIIFTIQGLGILLSLMLIDARVINSDELEMILLPIFLLIGPSIFLYISIQDR
tara:strand:+ start:421 stop:621 length:201 start_codon:yes stop_codon:yes gene_type:complete